MISFECDYNNGAHPEVLRHLVETNDEETLTYGFDRYTEQAKEKIKAACEAPDAEVFLLTGGTQTNATVIDGMLRSYEAVVCAETGHINVHEAGAIEASGHKVIGLPQKDGKLEAATLERFMEVFENDESRDHVAQPGMVYISFPTELGTLYSLSLLAAHCDAFYIGGTKVGALCGEAVVFTHNNTPRCFFSMIKRHGALLAKGRLTDVQFDALFTDDLYFRISRHAIEMAAALRDVLREAGQAFYVESPTNQQFVILPNKKMHLLEQQVLFTHWMPYDDDSTVCRFVTSWATKPEDIQRLRQLI